MKRRYKKFETVLKSFVAVIFVLYSFGIARNNEKQLIDFQVLAINDFHGQITDGVKISNRPAGGAAVLISYLKKAAVGMENNTIYAEVGDMVGASVPASALLQDEPSIMMFNKLGNKFCNNSDRLNPFNNLVATLGNHEWDDGLEELNRLYNGGNYKTGPFLENPWGGANFPLICANVVGKTSGKPIFPAYVIKKIPDTKVNIAFIGAILKETPSIVSASSVESVKFIDEVTAINSNVKKLRDSLGIHAFVVLIHQGQNQPSYDGPTDSSKILSNGEISRIVSELDDDVDVVCTAHSHSFTNVLQPCKTGKRILVTQALSKGTAYAAITMKINARSKDIVYKTAKIVMTWADQDTGLLPDSSTAELVNNANVVVGPIVNKIIQKSSVKLSNDQNLAGESVLGNFIADAQRSVMATDFSFMNPGGIRASIDSGNITWGALYTVQPFSNYLIKMKLSGQQIYDVLNQQWSGQSYARMLEVSGLNYTWDNNQPAGSKIVDVRKGDVPINKDATYTVTVNSFLAGGGDNFTTFKKGNDITTGPIDLDALITYMQSFDQPIKCTIEGRVKRLN